MTIIAFVKRSGGAAVIVLPLLFSLLCVPFVVVPISAAASASQAVLVTAHGRHRISVEIAATPEQRETGLMFRRSLAPDHGMLFIFDHAHQVVMWMKNTYIPLDMIFIRADGTIANIAENTEPFSEAWITSRSAAKAVLEVAAGTARRLGLRPGDRVAHEAIAQPR